MFAILHALGMLVADLFKSRYRLCRVQVRRPINLFLCHSIFDTALGVTLSKRLFH